MKVNRTILFVETDTNVLATYGKLLQREGFRVESAQDGLDALKALSQLRPDLVVLELMLPTFDGAESVSWSGPSRKCVSPSLPGCRSAMKMKPASISGQPKHGSFPFEPVAFQIGRRAKAFCRAAEKMQMLDFDSGGQSSL